MKLFKKEQKEKSWAIKLVEEDDSIKLIAVDSKTGEKVGYLLKFEKDGTIIRMSSVIETLKSDGYDPYEHNNQFDMEDSIIIN